MKRLSISLMVLLTAFTLARAGDPGRKAPDRGEDLLGQAQAVFERLPEKMPGSEADTPAMVQLGRKLYFETAISINRTQSCNSCHPVDKGLAGCDNLPTSPGAKGKLGDRNSPTTLNAGFQFSQFWDGRARDLAEQAKGPVLNPVEMGMPKEAAVIGRLRDAPDYERMFAEAFPEGGDPVTYENFSMAVGAFERTLRTTGRFDRFLDGEQEALSKLELQGLDTFMNKGCIQCHSGPLLGGALYQKMGLAHPYRNTKDLGRHKVTRKASDRYVFKVPQLRNITLTAPYFHDGRVGTLAEAVDSMAWLQLGERFRHEDIRAVLAFLGTTADEERMGGPAPGAVGPEASAMKAPDPEDAQMQDELVRYGHALVTKTSSILGLGAADQAMRYSGNSMACESCHLDAGTRRFGVPWVGVTKRFPQYRARSGRVADLEDRINGCFERSLNGKPLPRDSREMKAIVAYIGWLSQDASGNEPGKGTPGFSPPDRKADAKAGQERYMQYCQSCHGAGGEGYRHRTADSDGRMAVPPLWGKGSYNTGAGMNRLLTAAAFVNGNMPFGTTWLHPALSGEQAYDIAAYVNSQERPVKAGLARDYPNRNEKPVDCPYPPYSDNIPQEQHKYGPFQPILKAREATGQ